MSIARNSPIFTSKYRIYYEDTDAGGVVYYANYLKFFERARTEMIRDLGFSQQELAKKENIIFVVKNCQISYNYPARLDDKLLINSEMLSIKGPIINIRQTIYKILDKSDVKNNDDKGKNLADLTVQIIVVRADSFKPCRLPNNIADIFSKIALINQEY
jgi:tol-pal system-associated acyl-CoA thioesterase